jgi:hypothetical protein
MTLPRTTASLFEKLPLSSAEGSGQFFAAPQPQYFNLHLWMAGKQSFL